MGISSPQTPGLQEDQHDPLQVNGHIKYKILFFALCLGVVFFKTKNTSNVCVAGWKIISLTPEYIRIVIHAAALYGDSIRRLPFYDQNIADTA